jgi:hypothetical protein
MVITQRKSQQELTTSFAGPGEDSTISVTARITDASGCADLRAPAGRCQGRHVTHIRQIPVALVAPLGHWLLMLPLLANDRSALDGR